MGVLWFCALILKLMLLRIQIQNSNFINPKGNELFLATAAL